MQIDNFKARCAANRDENNGLVLVDSKDVLELEEQGT